MDFKEVTLENLIYEASQTEEGKRELKERGLEINGVLYRQLDLGSYGRADLIEMSIDTEHNIAELTVYELKQNVINVNTLIQAYRYKRALEDLYIEKVPIWVNVVLIGKNINTEDWVYILPSISDIAIITYEFSLKGLFFKKAELEGFYKEGNNNKTLELLERDYKKFVEREKEGKDKRKSKENGI